MTRAEANCGAAYTWASKALHPSVGFLNGWVVILTDIIFMSFAAPQGGAALLTLFNAWGLNSIGGLDLSASGSNAQTLSVILGVGFLGLVTYMVVGGVHFLAR